MIFCIVCKQNIKHIFKSIVEIFITNNEKKRLRKTVIIEQNSFWNDSIKTHIHKRYQHEHYVLFNDQNIFFYVNDQKIQKYHIENYNELLELRNFSITYIYRFQIFLQRLQTLNYINEKYRQWKLFSFYFENIHAICNRYFFFQNFNQQFLFILFANFHAKCLKNLTISCKNFNDSWISITNSNMKI